MFISRFPILLALVGAAIGIIIAPASALANPATLDVEAPEWPAELLATQSEEQIFSFEAGLSAKCKGGSYAGSISEPVESFTLTPSFTECTAFGLAATVTTSGCKYTYNAEEEGESGVVPVRLDVVCEKEKSITISTTTCELKISGQSGLKSIEASNTATTPQEVALKPSITGLSYSKTKDGLGCPLNGTGAKSDGGISGGLVMLAKSGGIQRKAQLGASTVWCEEDIERCPAGKNYGVGTTLVGEATNAKFVVQFDDTKNKFEFTIGCTAAKMTGTVQKGGLFGKGILPIGDAPIKLETWSTEGCKDEGGNECTVETLSVPVPHGIKVSGKKDGNGTMTGEIALRVVCKTKPFSCDYLNKQTAISFKGGNPGTLEPSAAAVPVSNKVTNCGGNALKWTGSYTLNRKGWIRRQ